MHWSMQAFRFFVFPEMGSKKEYLERFRKRGSEESFIRLMDEKWEHFITDVMTQTKLMLKPGCYLDDALFGSKGYTLI